MKKINYRNILPIYQMDSNGKVFDIRTGREIHWNPKTYEIKLKSSGLTKDFTYPDITTLYSVTYLGNRSRKNKEIAYRFYGRHKSSKI